MKRPIAQRASMLACLLALLGCGDAGTGVSNPPDATSSVASAVAAVFGSPSASTKMIVSVHKVSEERDCGDGDPGCTCDEALGGSQSSAQDDRHDIAMAPFADPGFYGAAQSGIQLKEQHFCALPSAPTTLNTTSTGPDGNGLLAKFTISADVTATCTNPVTSEQTTFAMKSGSTGVWRNTRAEDTGVAHEPEVYGRMILGTDSTSVTVNCTFFFDGNEITLSASCSDENGQAITINTAITCQVN